MILNVGRIKDLKLKINLPYKISKKNTSITFSESLYRWVGTLTNRIVFKRKTNEK
jgi:hypothetical protein